MFLFLYCILSGGFFSLSLLRYLSRVCSFFIVSYSGFFWVSFSLFFLDDGILGLAFGVLSAGYGGITMVFFRGLFFFSASVRGVRRRRGSTLTGGTWGMVHGFGPEHYYYYLLFFPFLFILLLHCYGYSGYYYYSTQRCIIILFCYTACRYIIWRKRGVSVGFFWAFSFIYCLTGLVALFLGTRLGLGDCYSTTFEY